jgi:hypothetical protein
MDLTIKRRCYNAPQTKADEDMICPINPESCNTVEHLEVGKYSISS